MPLLFFIGGSISSTEIDDDGLVTGSTSVLETILFLFTPIFFTFFDLCFPVSFGLRPITGEK